MKTILVVEDSLDVRFLYQCALESEDYKIVLAANGQEALDQLKSGLVPELILLDLTLPDMHGTEFIEQMKGNTALAQTRIVLVSGREELATTAKTLGVHGYLRKPFDLDHLSKTVEKIASKLTIR